MNTSSRLTSTFRLFAAFLLPVALIGASACGDDDDNAGQAGSSAGYAGSTSGTSGGTSGTSGGTAGSTAGTGGAAGASGTAGATQAQSDAQLAGVLSEINQGEIEQGHLAVSMGLRSDVIDYGNMMITMHGENQDKLMTLLQAKGITVAVSTDSEMVKATGVSVKSQLQSQPPMSTTFDNIYIQTQVSGHDDALSLLDNVLLPKVKDADLKAHFVATRADVMMHLDEAHDLSATSAGGAAGSTATGGASGSSGTAGSSTGGSAGQGGSAGMSGSSGQAGSQ